MDIVQQGLGIVSDILIDGVSEWTDSSVQDDDDWEIVDRLRTENDFASACLYAVSDEPSRVAIVAQLVKAAAGAVESLVISWDDEGRSEVPSLVAGQKACEAWLDASKKWLEEGK
jgi:hypothetical protein